MKEKVENIKKEIIKELQEQMNDQNKGETNKIQKEINKKLNQYKKDKKRVLWKTEIDIRIIDKNVISNWRVELTKEYK